VLPRSFVLQAYYLPNAERSNLTVSVNALVHKVVTRDVSGILTATGVEVSSVGIQHIIQAKKEVVLSAG
jgi:choline dehydrogenase-like flavoprotein